MQPHVTTLRTRRTAAVRIAGSLIATFIGAVSIGACSSDSGASDQTIAPLLTTTTSVSSTTTSTAPTTPAPTTTSIFLTPPTTSAPTTAPTTVAPSSTTTTTAPVSSRLVLRPDGLGDALFGADPTQVVSYVTSVLGEPMSDSDWVNTTTEFADCPGEELRVVRWRDLRLLFSDASPTVEGRRHFFGYVLGPPQRREVAPAGMRTASQIGVGNTVGEVRFTHPDVVLWDDELRGPSFLLADGINGTVDGLADGGLVTAVMAGPRCDG